MSDRDHIDLSPDKEIYRSAAVDVTYIDAVEELVDNAIDNWTRVSRRTDDIDVEIEAAEGRTVVRDNTGGLGEDQIHLLFALGETFQREVPGSIGAYGIGAKKAIVRLGENATIRSRERGADVGVGYRVDEEWMNSSNWEVEPLEFPDMDEGVTEIIVESDQDVWDEERTQALEEELSKTYAKFIDGRVLQGGSVDIIVNSEELQPGDSIPWSFTPFDGQHPRRYEGIELDNESLSESVTMDVTVGHMTMQDSELAGTDFYCQNRLVLESDTGETGGFGSTADNKIGNFTSQNNRLKVVVELNTEGDSSDLPWNSQKSDIDAYHPVTRAVHDWLRRLVKPYHQSDAGKMRVDYVAPYDKDAEEAANNGEIDSLDYSGRQRVGSGLEHKPDTDLPELKDMESMVKEHASKAIHYQGVEQQKEPAYERRLRSVASVDELSELDAVEDLTELKGYDDTGSGSETEATEFDHIDDVLSDVDGAGQARRDNLYTEGFETRSDLEEASVDELSSVDGIGQSVAESIKQAVAPEETQQGDNEGPEAQPKDEEVQEDTVDSDVDPLEGQDTVDSDTDPLEGEDVSTDVGSGLDEAVEDGDLEDDGGLTSVEDADQEVGNEVDEDIVRLHLNFDPDTYEDIRSGIGLPEDASTNEVSDVLREKLKAMFGPAVPPADD